jgi:hypothetical protein
MWQRGVAAYGKCRNIVAAPAVSEHSFSFETTDRKDGETLI